MTIHCSRGGWGRGGKEGGGVLCGGDAGMGVGGEYGSCVRLVMLINSRDEKRLGTLMVCVALLVF